MAAATLVLETAEEIRVLRFALSSLDRATDTGHERAVIAGLLAKLPAMPAAAAEDDDEAAQLRALYLRAIGEDGPAGGGAAS